MARAESDDDDDEVDDSGGEMTASLSPPSQSSRSFAALRNPDYRSFFLSSAIAMTADNIEHVISYWVIFEKFQSATLGGIAVITHWMPFLLLSVWAGGLADRYPRRRIIQIAQGLFMFASLAWGVLFLSGHLAYWHVVALLTIHGMAGMLWTPAGQVILHEMVKPEELSSAVRLNATARTLGILLGPAIGGGLMLAFGPAWAILVNAMLFIPAIAWCSFTRFGRNRQADGAAPPRPGLGDIPATLRTVRHDRRIIAMLLLGGAASFFVSNAFQAQMPQFAHDLGAERADFSYTLLLSSNAVGAIVASIVLESRGMLRVAPNTAATLVLLWCLAIIGFALSTSFVVSVCMMFLAGFLMLAYSSMAQTIVQMHAPPASRGRVIGLFNMAVNGLRTFSGISVGLLGSLLGVHWSLALSAVTLLAVTLALRLTLCREVTPQAS